MAQVKSHIQLTKALMKNFSQRKGGKDFVYYLNLTNLEIKEASIKELGVEFGYYDEHVEDKLSKIESKYGQATSQVIKFGKQDQQELYFNDELHDYVVNFAKYCILRSNDFVKQTNQSSVAAQLFGKFSHNQILSVTGDGNMKNPFDNYLINIIINNSKKDFVIPRNCIYSVYPVGKKPRIIMPVSPRRCIFLYDKGERSDFVDGEKQKYLVVHNEELVVQHNIRAYYTERQMNNDFVVAARKYELEDIVASLMEIARGQFS